MSTRNRSEAESREKIRTVIHSDSSAACAELAQEVASLIRARAAEGKAAVLGLATGSTPVPFYKELIRLHRDEKLSFKNVVTFNLDEYYGLKPSHRESYNRFMREQLFDHIDIPEENIHLPSGTTPPDEIFEACRQYEEAIAEAGGLDIQILGIGRTGHIGFNEPGSTRDSRTRRITLDAVTRRDAASDFLGIENVPRFAITMGVGTILAAHRIVLIAWGENKARVIAQATEGPVTDSLPASYLQAHQNVSFLIDAPASKELTRVKCPWLVQSVTWTPALSRKAVTWLSGTLRKPILKLVDREYNENGMAELLTEQGPAYNLNIGIFNIIQHTITGWPGGKPNADDAHRPERAAPFPKRVVIFSPEPHDAIVALAGTIERLCDQGHDLRLVYQTSGSLRVPDKEAIRFCRALLDNASDLGDEWTEQAEYAKTMIAKLESKGSDDVELPEVRRLKALLLRGEARNAARACGVTEDRVTFLDLPFYDKGRYRQFQLTAEDVSRVRSILEETRPHQIYATGNLADPSAIQSLCFHALRAALAELGGRNGLSDCRLWLYRGSEEPVQAHEIEMAVPMSPDQVSLKTTAINQFQSLTENETKVVDRDRHVAEQYDRFGMAEYEAIEAFERAAIPVVAGSSSALAGRSNFL